MAAASPEVAEPLVDLVCAELRVLGATVATGRFRTDMAVALVNDGPVTIVLEWRVALRPLTNRWRETTTVSVLSRGPADAWIAAYVGAARRSSVTGLPPWPNKAPPLGRAGTPTWWTSRPGATPGSPSCLLVVTAWAVAGLAVQPWLRDFVVAVVACLLGASDMAVAVAVGRARFAADATGLRVRQPLGSAVLPWSAVVGVAAPRHAGTGGARWGCFHRVKVVLELADGTRIAPFALQRRVNLRRPQGVERAVAEWHDLTELWRRFGPPAATTMWGRPAPPGAQPGYQPSVLVRS